MTPILLLSNLRSVGSLVGLTLMLSWSGLSEDPEIVTVPPGTYRETTAADLRPHPRNTKFYNERWDYRIDLEGGTHLSIGFTRVNLGSRRDPACGADMSLINFQGVDYVVAKQYSVDAFIYDDDREYLEVHRNLWFEGDLPNRHTLHFEAEEHGTVYIMEFVFSDIQPGASLGNGIYKFGEEEVGLYVHIPYARVEGSISIGGAEKTLVRGTAYMDHTFMTERPPKLIEASYRYVNHEDVDRWSVGYVLDPSKRFAANLVGYGIEAKAGEVDFRRAVAARILDDEEAASGVSVPRKMEVLYSIGDPVMLERTRDQQELSMLYDVRGIAKAIVRRYLGGEIMMFRGEGKLEGSRRMIYHYNVVK